MNAPIRAGNTGAPAAAPAVRTRVPAAAGGRIGAATGGRIGAAQPAQQAQQPQQPAQSGAIRTRVAPVANATRQVAGRTAAAPDTGWMKTGAAAVETAQREVAQQREHQERRAAGLLMPFRFWMGVGETAEYVVLDAQLGPCFYEHQLQNPRNGRYEIHEGCPKEWEPCPLCDSTKDSYYVMMLTVVDLRGYTKKDNTHVPYSRKLLPVKAQQQGFFIRQLERHGTLRGLHILGSRDAQQSPQIGNPEFVALHTEAEIIASFGHPPVMDSQNPQRVLKQQNADCFPFPYGMLFKKPSAADLRARYGGTAPAGSTQDLNEEWGSEGGVPMGAVGEGDTPPWDGGDAVAGVDLGEAGDEAGGDAPAQ